MRKALYGYYAVVLLWVVGTKEHPETIEAGKSHPEGYSQSRKGPPECCHRRTASPMIKTMLQEQ
jgi:hypothetical protein